MKIPFKVGESVRAKLGTKDVDNGSDISGWQGRIKEIHTDTKLPTLMVEWDSLTLKQMPPEVIIQCVREGFSWTEYGIDPEDVETATPRDTQEQVEVTQNELEHRYWWHAFDVEGPAIREVIDGIDPTDEMAGYQVWLRHLKEHLSLPVDAQVSEFQERGPLRMGTKVTIISLMDDVQDRYGIIAHLRKGRKTFHLPLCDLDARDKQSENAKLLHLYAFWFTNRPSF